MSVRLGRETEVSAVRICDASKVPGVEVTIGGTPRSRETEPWAKTTPSVIG